MMMIEDRSQNSEDFAEAHVRASAIGATLVAAGFCAAFAQAYGLSDDGALLVRPDGFVAWRVKSMVSDPEKALGRALDAVLMKV